MEEIDYELDDKKETAKTNIIDFKQLEEKYPIEQNDSKFIQNAIEHITFMQKLYTKIKNQSKELKLLIQDIKFEYKESAIYLKNTMDPTTETKYTMEYLINEYNNQVGMQEKINQSLQMQIDSMKIDRDEIQVAFQSSFTKIEQILAKVGKYR